MRRLKKPDSKSAPPSDVKTVMGRALDLLARREHSARELSHKLAARGFEAEHIDAVLEQLTSKGLLNEQRFMECYVQGRIQRGFGPLRIQAELRERGAESPDWSADTDINWFELAATARQKRFGAKAPEDFRERAKQMRFLQQRGFTSEQIRAVFSESD